jgi:dienelactone hydrolase
MGHIIRPAIREHAKEWGINPRKIGIMGASAGGHLVSTAVTHFTSDEDRPDFQILFYPWTIMDAQYGQVLLGKQPGTFTLQANTAGDTKIALPINMNGPVNWKNG